MNDLVISRDMLSLIAICIIGLSCSVIAVVLWLDYKESKRFNKSVNDTTKYILGNEYTEQEKGF